MNKVICEICGTSYPENAAQCPICGSARPSVAEESFVLDDEQKEKAESGYTYVKGGRFSKANVRKRNQAAVTPAAATKPAPAPKNDDEDDEEEDEEEDNDRGGKGLMIAVILLLLAIVAVAGYIFFRFFYPGAKPSPTVPQPTNNPAYVTTAPTTEPTKPTEPTVPCTGIEMSTSVVTLDKVGRAYLLNVVAVPKNTTDKVTYKSDNTKVAAVTPEGRIVAAGPGEATITVTCGKITKKCKVICDFSGLAPTTPNPTNPTTPTNPNPTNPQPTEPKPTEPQPTEPANDIHFNLTEKYGNDITFRYVGAKYKLYDGKADVKDVTFTSDNEVVATFIDGVVVAVGPGKTEVHAEYKGQKLSCTIRCIFETETQPTEPPTEPQPTEPEPTEEPETYTIYINGRQPYFGSEATFPIGDAFRITLVDSSGTPVDVTWTSADPSICEISGNKATPKAEGYTTLSTTYQGKTYTFKVIVRDVSASG